jgi:hypothetical protein
MNMAHGAWRMERGAAPAGRGGGIPDTGPAGTGTDTDTGRHNDCRHSNAGRDKGGEAAAKAATAADAGADAAW